MAERSDAEYRRIVMEGLYAAIAEAGGAEARPGEFPDVRSVPLMEVLIHGLAVIATRDPQIVTASDNLAYAEAIKAYLLKAIDQMEARQAAQRRASVN